MDDKRRDVALWRYGLIRDLADPTVSKRQRGELIRQLIMRTHTGPSGEPVRVSRPTINRWIRAWRDGGFDALMPATRRSQPVTPQQVLDLAEALKREAPRRTAAQIVEIITRTHGDAPSARTLQRYFAGLGLNQLSAARPRVYGRFEADHPNDLWTGDALHGPQIDGRKVYLFAFVDDHSRLCTGYRWGVSEDTLRLEAALRSGLASRGIPKAVYVDYADLRVMPNSAGSFLLRRISVLGLSA